MSTKTSIKRLALVAVSALGLGLLSVVPAKAASDTLAATSITAGTTAPFRAGQVVHVPLTIAGAFTASTTVNLRALAVAGPTGSVFATGASTGMAAASFHFGTPDTSPTSTRTASSSATISRHYPTGHGAAVGGATLINQAALASAGESPTTMLDTNGSGSSAVVYLSFLADVAGSYSFTVINDRNDDGDLTAGEVSSSLITVTTSNAPASAEVVVRGGTASAAGTASIAVTLKDAAGAVTVPNGAEVITLAASSTAVTLGATNLVASNFAAGLPGAGTAYTTATTTATATTTYTLTVASAGAINPSFTNTSSLTFTAAVNSSATATAASTSPLRVGTGTASTGFVAAPGSPVVLAAPTLALTPNNGTWTVPQGSFTWTVTSTVAAEASTTIRAVVTEIGGSISGQPGGAITYSVPVVLGATGTGTFTVTTARSSSAVAPIGYTVELVASGAGSASAFYGALVAASVTGTLVPNVTTISAAPGGSIGVTYNLKNSYGSNIANASVTVTVTGRNTRTIGGVTDASGNFTATYTDTGTTGTSDALTANAGWFVGTTSASASDSSVSIGYLSTNVVGTVTLTTPNTTAGVANDTVAPQNIKVGATGAQAATRPALSATVRTAAGVPLVGIPVTFSVAGTGVAIPSNAVTAFTNASGVATSSVYAWVSGTYTVTATAGGVSGTGTVTFNSQAGNERTISAAVSGNRVIATARDRFGNPVSGVTIHARIDSGTGYFGSSAANVAQGVTLADGTTTFVVSGGTAKVTVTNIPLTAVPGTIVGQTSAAKGFDIGGSGATALTAFAAGTTVTAETGVGSSFDAAGVASATVDVITADASTVASEAATDAALEAIDAANAATDAANLAAEAADAATVAAEEARDAADAATAAVEALASEVATLIAGLKAQITTLANTVAKIAKRVRA